MTTTLPVIESCDGCGACCMAMNSPPFIDDHHLMSDQARKSYERGMRQRDLDGWSDGDPCFWLDLETRRCIHYESRPGICRDALDCGDEACRRSRERHPDMAPRYRVQTWDTERQEFTPQVGLDKWCDLTKWELAEALRQLKVLGYDCHRTRDPDGEHRSSDASVLVERVD